MLRATTEQHTKRHMKTTFMTDNTITPFLYSVFHLGSLFSFAKEASALMQPELLCGMSLSPLPHAPKGVSLSETISSGDEDDFFFTFPTLNLCRMQVNWYLKVLGIPRFCMDIYTL